MFPIFPSSVMQPGLKAAWKSELGTRVPNVAAGVEKGTPPNAQRMDSNPCFSFLHSVMPQPTKDSVIVRRGRGLE